MAARNVAGLGDFVELQARTAVLRPQAPCDLELRSAEAEAVLLRWAAPMDDGGAPVLNYVIQATWMTWGSKVIAMDVKWLVNLLGSHS